MGGSRGRTSPGRIRDAHRTTTARAEEPPPRWGDRVLSAVVAGKRVSLFGDPDLVHTYTYIPDIGEGLSVLGTADDVTGRAWHLPNDPNPWTSRAMAEELFRLAGTTPRIGSIPKVGLMAIGLFNPTVRELAEISPVQSRSRSSSSSATSPHLAYRPRRSPMRSRGTLEAYRS